MKIETKILVDFLKHIEMGAIDECLLRFEEDGLHIDVMSLSFTQSVTGFLKKESFIEYVTLGNIGVDSFSQLIKVLGRLGKEIEFEVSGNILSAKGKIKELAFELVDEKFIKETKDLPNLTHETKFVVNGDMIKSFLDDVKLNKDASIFIETVDNGVKLTNDGKYKFTYNIDSKDTKSGQRVKLGAPFQSVMSSLTGGDIICHIKTDTPLVVEYTTEEYTLMYMIAPLVEQK